MKRNIFLLSFLISSFYLKAQLPIYKCEFADSIGALDYNSVISSIRKSFTDKNISPEIIDEYISKYFNNPSSLAIVQSRIVEVYHDSSIININYDGASNNRIILEMPGNKMKVENGQVFRYNRVFDSYTLLETSERSQIFIPTGQEKDILGFICDEYISLDSNYKIWITDKLPMSINPGIGIKNIKKAVLGFEAKSGNAYTKAVLCKIENL